MLFHVWFATKRRKWLLQGELVSAAKAAIRTAAEAYGIELIEVEAVVDHVHLLLDVEPRTLPRTMNLLKGMSARSLFLQFPELKLDEETNSFWQAGYGRKPVQPTEVDTVRHYIRTQWDRLEDYETRISNRGRTTFTG